MCRQQNKNMIDKVPLYRAISKLGFASRNQALLLIKSGEIIVGNKVCFDPDYSVSINKDSISYKGNQLKKQKTGVVMLYKPRGIITSRSDEQGRPTVYSLLPPEFEKYHCVGRLDWATSGLLLLTNNTALSSWLTDPSNGVRRIYIVTVRGLMNDECIGKMRSGIADKGQILQCDDVVVRKSSRRESHLVITLSEGKNREIRRICSCVGHEVTKLKRVQYGLLTLGDLEPGKFRVLTADEVTTAFPKISNSIDC